MQFGISSIHSATKQLRGALTLVGGSLHGNGASRGHDSDQKPLIKSPFDTKGFAGLQDDSDSESDFSFAYETNEVVDEIKSSVLDSSKEMTDSDQLKPGAALHLRGPSMTSEKRHSKAVKVDGETEKKISRSVKVDVESETRKQVHGAERQASSSISNTASQQAPVSNNMKTVSVGHSRPRTARRTKSNPDSLVGISKYLGENEIYSHATEEGKVDAAKHRSHEGALKVRHTSSKECGGHAVDRTRPRPPRRSKSDPESLVGICQTRGVPPARIKRDGIAHHTAAPTEAVGDGESERVNRISDDVHSSEPKKVHRDSRTRSRVAPRRRKSDPTALVGMLIHTQDNAHDIDVVDLEELENLEKMLELNATSEQPTQCDEPDKISRPRAPRRRKSDPLSLVGIAQQYLETGSTQLRNDSISGTKPDNPDSRDFNTNVAGSLHSTMSEQFRNQNEMSGRRNIKSRVHSKSDPEGLLSLSKHFETNRLKERDDPVLPRTREDGHEIPVRWVQMQGQKHLELNFELSNTENSRRLRRNSGSRTVA